MDKLVQEKHTQCKDTALQTHRNQQLILKIRYLAPLEEVSYQEQCNKSLSIFKNAQTLIQLLWFEPPIFKFITKLLAIY